MITKEKLHLSHINVVIFRCISIITDVNQYWLFFFSFSDLGHCCWSGGPVGEGSPSAMGPEDNTQVPRSQRPRLHPVMAGRTRLQCHHPQKQVIKSHQNWVLSAKSLFLPSCEGVSLSAAALWWQQMTTETGGWEVTDSAAKSVSLSATVVACHNNTKFGRSHNFQLITAAH